MKRKPWQDRLQHIIFGTDTPKGRNFDILLIVAIVLSFLVIVISTVRKVEALYGDELYIIEWGFTILFTIEYVLRLISIRHKLRYATSFFGIVDLLSILPTYLSLFIVGSQNLAILRTLRLIRIFRVLGLRNHNRGTKVIIEALLTSIPKITVFFTTVFAIVIVMGGLMYVIEGEESGFTSIPRSIYWAIVTITTVGYGDIAPQTVLGQALASFIMLLGYSIIAVPTGIVSSEMNRSVMAATVSDLICPSCERTNHPKEALFCYRCGESLKPRKKEQGHE